MSARGTGFSNRTYSWLKGLGAHNDTVWFADHRGQYQTRVQTPFVPLLQEVTHRPASTAVPLRDEEQTSFRINRDVRFSTDKSPYNTSRSALLTRDGTKSRVRRARRRIAGRHWRTYGRRRTPTTSPTRSRS